MGLNPIFPTKLQNDVASLVRDYFMQKPIVDTVLVVNSCARGVAVQESDLDFAILVKPNADPSEIENIQSSWCAYAENHSVIKEYRGSNQFAHLHLDIIEGNYIPTILEVGVASDYFEIEIGNQICYSAPMDSPGNYFKELQNLWLPYYNEELRLKRLIMTRNACEYDLNHIPYYIKRGLYFQAFDTL